MDTEETLLPNNYICNISDDSSLEEKIKYIEENKNEQRKELLESSKDKSCCESFCESFCDCFSKLMDCCLPLAICLCLLGQK